MSLFTRGKTIKCARCDHRFDVDKHNGFCPKCGKDHYR